MSTVESTSAWAQTLSSISSALSTHLQDKMLKKMDTDSSGGVDQTEFKAALEKVAGKLGVDAGEGAEELYASLDADSDGSLNGGEVGQLLQQLFTPPQTPRPSSSPGAMKRALPNWMPTPMATSPWPNSASPPKPRCPKARW